MIPFIWNQLSFKKKNNKLKNILKTSFLGNFVFALLFIHKIIITSQKKGFVL